MVFVWYCSLQQSQWHLQRNVKLFQAAVAGTYSATANILLSETHCLSTAQSSVVIIKLKSVSFHQCFGFYVYRTDPDPDASRSSDDDNCSLSIAYKRHIFPHRDAFDTPAFITSERLARAQRGLAEHTSLIRVKRNARAFVWFERAACCEQQMHGEQHSETGKKPNGKQWRSGLAKLLGWT